MKKSLLFLFLLFSPFTGFSEIPDWMKTQIENDFCYFKDKPISLKELEAFYEKKASQLQLVKYTIVNNEVSRECQHVDAKKLHERINRYSTMLKTLCQTKELPNTTLLISVNDGLNAKEEMPIFAMCKMDSNRIILIPDYEALGTRYQVLRKKGIDLAKTKFPWEAKISKMIWRGSTAQRYSKLKENNLHLFSRVKLCELSQLYPEIIDAKFTLFVQGGDSVPYLYNFQGEHVSFEEQMNYKYHILIDGNVCPYTKSGWKLFTNSLIFKPDSLWVQWYFNSLVPYVHYVPLHADLSDLVEKLQWALDHEAESKQIAGNTRQFAVEQFTHANHLLYLYEVIKRYQELNFVP
jgi:Glycosyl transferase family 90